MKEHIYEIKEIQKLYVAFNNNEYLSDENEFSPERDI